MVVIVLVVLLGGVLLRTGWLRLMPHVPHPEGADRAAPHPFINFSPFHRKGAKDGRGLDPRAAADRAAQHSTAQPGSARQGTTSPASSHNENRKQVNNRANRAGLLAARVPEVEVSVPPTSRGEQTTSTKPQISPEDDVSPDNDRISDPVDDGADDSPGKNPPGSWQERPRLDHEKNFVAQTRSFLAEKFHSSRLSNERTSETSGSRRNQDPEQIDPSFSSLQIMSDDFHANRLANQEAKNAEERSETRSAALVEMSDDSGLSGFTSAMEMDMQPLLDIMVGKTSEEEEDGGGESTTVRLTMNVPALSGTANEKASQNDPKHDEDWGFWNGRGGQGFMAPRRTV